MGGVPTPTVERTTIGGPAASSWREQALTRVAELEDLTDVLEVTGNGPWRQLVTGVRRHLKTAREAAEGDRRNPLKRAAAFLAGSPLERTASNIDAAESDLLRIASDQYVASQMPSLLAHVRAHLRPEDPRRERMEELAEGAGRCDYTSMERDSIASIYRAASSAARREVVQVRSFRNVLIVGAVVLTCAAVGLAVVGVTRPDVLPLCFAPEGAVVCPTGEAPISSEATVVPTAGADGAMRDLADTWDIVIVEVLGLIAAAVAAAIALRNIHGTTTPYSLPVALALIKLPLGALTAILGLLLMRANFVPGLSALDSPSQILGWAIVFGYAQQVFTRFVDQRAHDVLNEVGQPAAAEAGASATQVGAARGTAPAT